ncbi:conserved Plasmodium protein, unknown function [Plasmodium vivax]|uniref:C2H2-type domain-containing protein n=1 Tax=Plasmodium vivax TaxID=5855 RepID=A0A565A0B0_PLAVI|nr:conserved Plasmodium protein, unknown function [Plasmodium vivax]
MTNVVSARPKEEKDDAWLNLNDIRQNAKKHNWQENPGKQNNYIFSKDNVKICIIGLKGLVTIDIRLISGVNYKMCKSNLKKEEIYDLFSTSSFFNYTNDVLEKTVLCNSYNLTVKEKIDLFNKNDKSFLQGLKCNDILFRSRGGAKMGTTKVRGAISTSISSSMSSATKGERRGEHNSVGLPEEKKVQVQPELQPEGDKQLQRENAHIRNGLHKNALDVTPFSKAVLSKEEDKDNKKVVKKICLFNKHPRDNVSEKAKGCPIEGGEISRKGSANRKEKKNCSDYGVKKGDVEGETTSPPHMLKDHTSEIEEAEKLNVDSSQVSTEIDANKNGTHKTKGKKQNLNDNPVRNKQQLTPSPGGENDVATPHNNPLGKFNSGENSSLRYASTKGNSKECLEWCDTLSSKRECLMSKSFTTHSLSEEDLNNEALHRMSASEEETANWCSGEGHTNGLESGSKNDPTNGSENGPKNDPTNGPPLHAAKTHDTDLAPSRKGGEWCVREGSPSHPDCPPGDDVVDGAEGTNGHLEKVTDEGGSPIDCNAGHKTNTVNIYIQNNTVQYYGPKYRHGRKGKARWAWGEEGLSHLRDYRSCGDKWGSKWGNQRGNKWDNHWDNWDYYRDDRRNNWHGNYNHHDHYDHYDRYNRYSQPGTKSLLNGQSFHSRNSHHLAARTPRKYNYRDKYSAYYSPSWAKRVPKYYTADSRKAHYYGSVGMVGSREEATSINAEGYEKNGKSGYPFWGVQKGKGAHHVYDESGFYITQNRNNYTRRKYNERKPSDALQPYEAHINVKELEKDIYYKLSYLKHFKHDYTKSIPRYFCTFRHLLAPSRTRKRPLWLQNMLDTNKCGYCDEQFSSLKNLENHFVHVKTHRIYYCCGKPFSSLKYLSIHLRRDNHYGYVYYY